MYMLITMKYIVYTTVGGGGDESNSLRGDKIQIATAETARSVKIESVRVFKATNLLAVAF